MNEILLIGAGGHARSCIDVIESISEYKIIGLVEKNNTKEKNNLGYPIVGCDDDLPYLRDKYEHAVISLGQIKTANHRKRIFNMLNDLEYNIPTIISPRAYISKHSRIGEGAFVFNNVIINSNVEIGKNCIINNKVLIEHDANIGNHCHIATGAIINGGVKIGHRTFIGSGVVTKQSIEIGSDCIVGAGEIIKKNIQ